MRLSVSSLTCPEWNLERMLHELVKHHIPALDLRTLEGRRDVWNLADFAKSAREETRRTLEEAGILLGGVSTSVRAGASVHGSRADTAHRSSDGDTGGEGAPEWREELTAALDLCSDLGGRYLRIFAGSRDVESLTADALEAVASDYRRMCLIAEPFGLLVLLETHDVVSSGTIVRDIVRLVDHPLAGVVWDVRHPLHLAGETYEQTAETVAEVLRLVHVKDFDGSSFDLVPFGTGAVDTPRLLSCLRSVGFDGDLVLEQPRVAATGRPMPEQNIAGFAAAFDELLP